ncbi:MAG TPA: LamG domain-containing protein [Flavobacteriales bacterium]|nr:LamG domain-containing protein [Flavobacteriales bacterium]
MKRCYALPALLFLVVYTNAQTDPLMHWRLDENAGTVAHDVEHETLGILQNGTLWDPTGGHHQGACRFDGIDDVIVLGPCDITTGGGEMSLSLWVKPDFVTAADRAIIIKTLGASTADHIWSLSFVDASAIRFNLRTGSTTTELSTPTSSISSGTWYHIAATYDGSSMRIWLNASLMAENQVTGTMGYHPEGPATIGSTSTGGDPFSGWIDDVRIYDQGLSGDEILDILLEEEVATQVRIDPPWIGQDSKLHLPAGDWNRLELLDAAGRSVSSVRVTGNNAVLDMGPLPAGLYLVCLQDEGKRASWPVVVP